MSFMKFIRSYPLFLITALGFSSEMSGADLHTPGSPVEFTKPAWLTDLSLGGKEGYDDNVMLVAGKNPGLPPKSSWITTVSPKIGFNFAPLFGKQTPLQTFSLVYSPDFNFYHDASSESYNAHRIGNVIKGKAGNFSFSLDNAFLFNDGDSQGPVYALDQGAAAAGQYDKNRNAYATAIARERRKQIQERNTIVLQYDAGKFFIRPTASLLYYDLMTGLHKTSLAPYKGYQNYSDRADVNGGLDLGWKVTKDLAITAGYRYGYQYQQAYPSTVDSGMVNGQQMQSSANYQRILFGLEGKPWKWLTVKLAAGPEFRDYNSAAPVDNYHPLNYYGEAVLTATLTSSQTLSFLYKHWQWVASTGKVPYADSSYTLTYHWNATKQLGFDLTGKAGESDYNYSSVVKTSNSCLRDDIMYSLSAGVTYAFTPHFSTTLGYTYDFGRNLQDNVPAPGPGYREFDHQLVTLSAQYKF